MKALRTVYGFLNDVTGLLQVIGDEVKNIRFVFYDQNSWLGKRTPFPTSRYLLRSYIERCLVFDRPTLIKCRRFHR
jgi:hypothetical protein